MTMRIRLEDGLAFVFRQAFGEAAFVILRRVSFETVFLAGVEVVGAVAGRGVHDAAALIERDVIGEHAGNLQSRNGCWNFVPSNSQPFQPPLTRADFDFQFIGEARRRDRLASSSLPADVSATTYSKSG